MAVPSPDAKTFTPELTTQFTEFMNRQFAWKAGAWQMSVHADYGSGKQISRQFRFSLDRPTSNR